MFRRNLDRSIPLADPIVERLEGRHFLDKYMDKRNPDCVVCSIRPDACKLGKQGNCKRKQAKYFCNTCLQKPALCIVSCFEAFHTKRDYKKKCECIKKNE